MQKLLIPIIASATILFSLTANAFTISTTEMENRTNSCFRGNAASCRFIGSYYEGEMDHYLAKRFHNKANDLYKKACDRGSTKDCEQLAIAYVNGFGVQKDYTKANEIFENICDMGYAPGCNRMSRAYDYGLGVRQDYLKANEFSQRSCSLGDPHGCYMVGYYYEWGFGVRFNFTTAKDFYGKACDLGNQKGCDAYARLNRMNRRAW